MSDTSPPPEEDGIPPGKRLVRAGGGAGLSLGERLAAQFYRLTWRTPLHSFRLKGRHPLKLLAAPNDPIAGNAEAGKQILAGALVFEGESAEFDENWALPGEKSPALARHYHSFVWLRDLAAAGSRGDVAPTALRAVRSWISAHGDSVSEPAWAVAAAARRLLIWPSYAPLLLGNNDLVFRSTVLNTLARTARHVERMADRVPPGLERVTAWCGVVAAGLLIAGGDARRLYGENALVKSLGQSMTEDGGLTSRSPQEQLELVALLSELRAVYDARQMRLPQAIGDFLARAVPPLLGVIPGDGGLASWQGSVPTLKSRVDAVITASGERARPLRQAREWGYQRMNGGESILIFDAAPPPQSRSTRNGCASTLAMELSDGAHRLIVNCGGSAAAGLQSTGGLSEGLRTTAAHSTLTLADTNSTSVLVNGALGKGVDEVELDRQETENGSRVEASHDGYGQRYGFVHRRAVALSSDGREVRGEDTLVPVTGRRKPSEPAFAVRFHLAPNVEPAPTADSLGALLRIDGGALWQFRCRGGALNIEPSLWVDGDGKWHQSQQLVISGTAAAGGATIGWVLKRAG